MRSSATSTARPSGSRRWSPWTSWPARRSAASAAGVRRRWSSSSRTPRRLAISSEGGPAKARATFDLESAGDNTVVKFTLDVELRGAARFAGPLVKSATQHEVRSTLERLKEVAEQ